MRSLFYSNSGHGIGLCHILTVSWGSAPRDQNSEFAFAKVAGNEFGWAPSVPVRTPPPALNPSLAGALSPALAPHIPNLSPLAVEGHKEKFFIDPHLTLAKFISVSLKLRCILSKWLNSKKDIVKIKLFSNREFTGKPRKGNFFHVKVSLELIS